MTESETIPSIAERVRRRFEGELGAPAAALCFAPGRLNLIGAHLDYSGGDVLPLAVDLGVYVAARLRDDGRLRLVSVDQRTAVDLDASELGARAASDHGWAAYPLGVWREFAALTGEVRGVDMVFGGDLPMASGLSSSAAIEVATGTALTSLLGLELDPVELASIAHRAENEFVGLQCGIMDQFASALGRDGHALLLHCGDRSYEHVPIESARFEVLVVNSKRPRSLVEGSEFNRRVAECAEAFEILCREVGARPVLAAFTPDEVAAAEHALGAVLFRRARHVAGEMRRVRAAVDSLRAGDVGRLGRLVSESHESTRVDYDVSCAELDAITAVARDHEHGLGARLTGAGFGGCAFALVEPGYTDDVAAAVKRDYTARFGLEPGFAVLRAGGGPRCLS